MGCFALKDRTPHRADFRIPSVRHFTASCVRRASVGTTTRSLGQPAKTRTERLSSVLPVPCRHHDGPGRVRQRAVHMDCVSSQGVWQVSVEGIFRFLEQKWHTRWGLGVALVARHTPSYFRCSGCSIQMARLGIVAAWSAIAGSWLLGWRPRKARKGAVGLIISVACGGVSGESTRLR